MYCTLPEIHDFVTDFFFARGKYYNDYLNFALFRIFVQILFKFQFIFKDKINCPGVWKKPAFSNFPGNFSTLSDSE